MKNEATFPLSPQAHRTALAALCFSACLTQALANELKDLVLAGGQSPALKFVFSEGQSSDAFPLYFQKPDSATGTITFCFLETPTSLPLGKLNVPENGVLGGLSLKKVTTPSGKNFLGVELLLSKLPAGELSLLPSGGNSLKIKLPGKAHAKLQWSALQAVNTPPAPAPSSEPVSPPVPSGDPVSEPAPGGESVSARAPGGEPVSAAAPGPKVVAQPGTLSDLSIVVGSSQQDLLLQGEGFGAFAFTRNTKDTLAYELRVAGAKVAFGTQSLQTPKGALFASLKVKQVKDTAVLSFRLRRAAVPQAGMAGTQIAVTVPEGGDTPLKWSAGQGKIVASGGMPESLPSAHSEGEAIDQGQRGLSSSLVFLPGGLGKPMILMRDSAALREKPKVKAKTIKTLPAGAQILKLETDGQWFRVVSESDTGFIRKGEALYADELTTMDEARLQKLVTAREKALEARRLKEEERIAKAAAAEAAAQQQAQAQAVQAQVQGQAKTETPPEPSPESAKNETPTQPEPAEVTAQVASQAPEASAKKAEDAATAPLHIAAPDEQKLSQVPDAAMQQRIEQERLAAERDKMKTAEGPIAYNSFGRRDPFIPVEQGNLDNGIDIDQMKVVGIVWQASDPMAVLQHVTESSVSFTVKQGDPVHNGRVSRITRDAVTFDITEYGISRSYSLKLVSMQERAKK